jgi:hypothetical protein
MGWSYIFLPLARLYRPIWEYDAKVLAKDLGDQLVYGVSAAAADGLLRALTTGATRPRFQWQAVTVPLSIRHAAAEE